MEWTKTVGWLSEEVKEPSDVVAWAVSIANICDIDVEAALNKKYPHRCISCGKTPCVCES